MSSPRFKSCVKPRPALLVAAAKPVYISPALARPSLTAIRPAMVELGRLRLLDVAYPGPAVLEAVARRLLGQ